jgi:hypothetical protein
VIRIKIFCTVGKNKSTASGIIGITLRKPSAIGIFIISQNGSSCKKYKNHPAEISRVVRSFAKTVIPHQEFFSLVAFAVLQFDTVPRKWFQSHI